MGEFEIYCAGANSDLLLPVKRVSGLLLPTPMVGISERTITQTQKLLKEVGPSYFMLDSGGFQLHEAERNGLSITLNADEALICKGRLNIAPIHVVQTAERLNPDIIAALDFPIQKRTGDKEQTKEFKKKLPYNVWMANETGRLVKDKKLKGKLYLPVQAYTVEQFGVFFKHIDRRLFQGVSMPVRNCSAIDIAKFCVRFYQECFKELHLFGTTAARAVALGAYMSRRGLFEWVSMDARTWTVHGTKQRYLYPHTLKAEHIKDVDDKADCPCEVCKQFSLSDLKEIDPQDRSYLISSHNYLVIRMFAHEAYVHAADEQFFEQFVNRSFTNKKHAKEVLLATKIVAPYVS